MQIKKSDAVIKCSVSDFYFSAFVLHIFHDLTDLASQGGTNAIQNVTVITNNTIFIIAVYRLKFNLGSLDQLISGDPVLIQIFVYR